MWFSFVQVLAWHKVGNDMWDRPWKDWCMRLYLLIVYFVMYGILLLQESGSMWFGKMLWNWSSTPETMIRFSFNERYCYITLVLKGYRVLGRTFLVAGSCKYHETDMARHGGFFSAQDLVLMQDILEDCRAIKLDAEHRLNVVSQSFEGKVVIKAHWHEHLYIWRVNVMMI